MAKKDEISSTEKLLGLIRQKENKVPPAKEPEPVETLKKFPQPSVLSNVIPMRKKACVGIDIGYHELKLAMINKLSDKRHELVDFISVPYEADMTPGSSNFPQFLRNTLIKFCGGSKKNCLVECHIVSQSRNAKPQNPQSLQKTGRQCNLLDIEKRLVFQ